MRQYYEKLAKNLVRRLRVANLPHELVIDFITITKGTLGDWLGESQFPSGIRLSRLQHLLDLLNIGTEELDNISPLARYLGRVFALRLVTREDVEELLGGVSDQAVLDTILGLRDPESDDVDKKAIITFEQLVGLYGEQLAEKEAEWLAKFAKAGYTPPSVDQSAATTPAPPQVQQVVHLDMPDSSWPEFPVYAAQELGRMLPLARYLVSGNCTPAQRSQIRRLLGGEGMFELSTLFNQLCGERSRDDFRNRGGE